MNPPSPGAHAPVPTDEQLRGWIRAYPETWDSARDDEVALDAAIVRRVLDRRADEAVAPSRWRTRVGAAVVVGLISAGTAVGVTAVVRSNQPSQPQAGVACRAAASLDADTVVIMSVTDPIAACAAAWEAGRLTPTGGDHLPAGSAPELVACIGVGGGVEVFPGDDETCDRLGLDDAASELDDESRTVVALQDRIAIEVNMTCVSGADVRPLLERILADAGLTGWTIQFDAAARRAACVRVSVDGATRALVVAATT